MRAAIVIGVLSPAMAGASPELQSIVSLGTIHERMLAQLSSAAARNSWAPPVQFAASGFGEFDEGDRDVVSAGRAVAYSLLLPGAGQWYIGRKQRAGVFLAADAAAWTLWGYFRKIGSIKENDQRNFAQRHAGVVADGKDDDFYRTLTFYDSRDQFNETRSPFRSPYPNTADYDWQWDSDTSRKQYRDIRNQSKEGYNRAKFALGAAVLTRLVAALDSWRTARSINRTARMDMAGKWKVRFKPRASLTNPSLKVIFSRRF